MTLACNGQEEPKAETDTFLLTISPIIDKEDKDNNVIISSLIQFLKTKNNSLSENQHWLASDFSKYIYPYLDIYQIEHSKHGNDFFKPTLMEIIPSQDVTKKIVKIAFIGHQATTKENFIKLIFNLVANIENNEVQFSRYLDFSTQDWQTVQEGSLRYKISPNKSINQSEIERQQKDIEQLCEFFETTPLNITYYSCVTPKEIFEIKGFDYHPMMYVDKTGGLADHGNIIFSGNNAECYTHEIVHIYTNNLFPTIDKFLDEGIATYIGGSGKYDYRWHREKLKNFLNQHPDFNFVEHTDPYEKLYFEGESPIPYLAAALICERTLRIYGKNKLLEIFKMEGEFWTKLNLVGLTKENINEELRKEI